MDEQKEPDRDQADEPVLVGRALGQHPDQSKKPMKGYMIVNRVIDPQGKQPAKWEPVYYRDRIDEIGQLGYAAQQTGGVTHTVTALVFWDREFNEAADFAIYPVDLKVTPVRGKGPQPKPDEAPDPKGLYAGVGDWLFKKHGPKDQPHEAA